MNRENKAKKTAFMHGTYAIIVTVLVIIGAIIVNILATALAARFPLNIDLTADKTYSISQKNADYIKNVTKPVTITVCAAEDDYASASGLHAQYAKTYYNTVDSTGMYFGQTITLLQEYTKYNSNITLKFADPQLPSFSDVQQRFSDQAISYGDILVESSFDINGQTISRNRVLGFQDIYEQYDASGYASMGYGTYSISGSNLEESLTSAIYAVTSEKTTQVSLLTGHSNASDVSGLQATMEKNNYAFSTLDNLLIQDIPAETDLLIITAPTSDFSGDELSKIDAFLANDNQRGKGLLFFAGASSPDLPNLYDFLAEWGIKVSSGTLYETNENNYIGTPTTIGLQNSASDYTASANEASNVVYVADSCLPMEIGFTSQGNRTTTELMATSDTVVVRPAGVGDEWSPSGKGGKAYSAGIVSKDMIYGDNMAELSSYVVAFSSTNLIDPTWDYYSAINNSELILSAVNSIVGRDADSITITSKIINNVSYYDRVTGLTRTIMTTIFAIVLPVAVIATGIIVWVRRKNR